MLNYASDDVTITVARGFLFVTILMHYPVLLHPTRANINGYASVCGLTLGVECIPPPHQGQYVCVWYHIRGSVFPHPTRANINGYVCVWSHIRGSFTFHPTKANINDVKCALHPTRWSHNQGCFKCIPYF